MLAELAELAASGLAVTQNSIYLNEVNGLVNGNGNDMGHGISD